MPKVVFLSHMKTLSVSSNPIATATVMAGQVVNKLVNNHTVLFRDNRFETEDEDTIKFLREHAGFGKLFWEIPSGTVTSSPEKKPPQNIPGVKTKNEVLLYLSQNGIPKEVLKGKTLIELVQVGAEKLNVIFNELNSK